MPDQIHGFIFAVNFFFETCSSIINKGNNWTDEEMEIWFRWGENTHFDRTKGKVSESTSIRYFLEISTPATCKTCIFKINRI